VNLAIEAYAHHSQNGTQTAEDPPAAYKCLHETILRRATGFQTEPFFTGSQPKTSVYNSGLVAMQYARPVSLWHADCQAEACGGWPYCADTITQGLFYASASETLPGGTRPVCGSKLPPQDDAQRVDGFVAPNRLNILTVFLGRQRDHGGCDNDKADGPALSRSLQGLYPDGD
jgi:hypothetical protein